MRRVVVALAMAAFVASATGAVLYGQAAKAPANPIILKGNPMGGVKFDHTAHTKAGAKCEQCHHASKPEMAAKAAQQKCTDCHTKTPTPPMKTNVKAAFHDAMAKKGTCVDCHAEAVKAGKTAPVKCADCHKKENV